MAARSKKAWSRSTHVVSRRGSVAACVEALSGREMSNVSIIVLVDAEAVPVRTLADRLRMHPVEVVKDLAGPRLHAGLDPRRSQPFGRWRSGEMTPNAISPSAVRSARDDHARPVPHSRRRAVRRRRPRRAIMPEIKVRVSSSLTSSFSPRGISRRDEPL